MQLRSSAVGHEALDLGFPGSNPGGAATLKESEMLIAIVIIIASIIYSELFWYLIKTGHKTYEDSDQILKTVVYFNYLLGVSYHAWGCLIFASVGSLYQMVILKERVKKLN